MKKKFWLNFTIVFIGFTLLGTALCQAQVNSVSNVTISPLNPSPGNTVTVNWTYSEASAYNNPAYFITVSNACNVTALNANLWVVIGDGCVPEATQSTDVGSGCNLGSNVPMGTNTASKSITIPTGLTPGTTYYVSVVMREYNIAMNPTLEGGAVQACTSFTVPLPAPYINLSKTAQGTTANAGSTTEILYTIYYSAGNVHNFAVTDVLSPDLTVLSVYDGGTNSAGTLTWNLGNISSPQTGFVSFLAQSPNNLTAGTIIHNTATGGSSDPVVATSNDAPVIVDEPGLSISKSVNTTSAALGAAITYTLEYSNTGTILSEFQNFDNDVIPAGWVSNGGTWVADNDPAISSSAGILEQTSGNPTGNSGYPSLVDTTMAPLQNGIYIVDMYINPTDSGHYDAVLNFNTTNDTLVSPYNVFQARINSANSTLNYDYDGTGGGDLASVTNPHGLSILAENWYTVEIEVCSGDVYMKVWPQNTTAPAAWDLTYTGAQVPTAAGWVSFQANQGQVAYDNLKVFSFAGSVGTTVNDVIPTGVSYVGSSAGGSNSGPGTVTWSVGGTCAPAGLSWWGTITGCGPIVNTASIFSSALTVISNSVSTTITGCTTNTATNTDTATVTNTPTNTATNTDTATITNTDTSTPTSTATSTATNTATDTPLVTSTFTNTPTVTVTNTVTNSATDTDTATVTNTYTDTVTSTATATVTDTATDTSTPTLGDTATNTATATVTETSTLSSTFTTTPTLTLTFTATNTPTNTPTVSNTNTYTLTFTATNTSTVTVTPTPTAGIFMVKNVSENQAHAGDALTYSIAVTVTGEAVNGMVVTDTLPAGVSFVSFLTGSAVTGTFNQATDLLQWIMPSPLAPGVYDLSYETQVNNFVLATVPIVNKAQLTYPGQINSIISSAPVTIIGQFTVSIDVYDSAGEVVKTIASEEITQSINSITLQSSNTITTLKGAGSTIEIYFAGVLIGTWDGTNDTNQPVTNGQYMIKLDNISSQGVVTSVSQAAIVNRSLSDITANIYNSAGEIVKTLYDMVSDPIGSNMTNVMLNTNVIRPGGQVSQGKTSQVQVVVQTSGTPVTLLWDGTNNSDQIVSSGEYEIQVHWNNGSGQTTDISRQILVIGAGASGVAIAKPNVLDTSNGMITTFDGMNITNASTVNAQVYTITGELVESVSGTAGTAEAQWNASTVASGIYLAVIETLNSNGGLIARQTVKILVLK